jgi:hypothetical protein
MCILYLGHHPPPHSSPSSILEWSFENLVRAVHQQIMPEILATQEAESRRFTFQSMPRLKGVKWKLYHLVLPLVIHGQNVLLLIPLVLCFAGLEVLEFLLVFFNAVLLF